MIKFWGNILDFALAIWSIKYRLMLVFLIGLAGYAHYREFANLYLAIVNGAGVLGLSVIGALAWTEVGVRHD